MPPINEELILEITHMVTEETLGKDTNSGWRGSHVQVISVRQKVIYPASFGSFPKQIKYRWNRFIRPPDVFFKPLFHYVYIHFMETGTKIHNIKEEDLRK